MLSIYLQVLRGPVETDPTSLFTGLFLGLMAVMAAYNLVLYFSLNDKAYLIYVGIVLLNIGNIISLNGVGSQYLWYSEELRNDRLYVVFGSMSYVLAIWFANIFLNVKALFPKIYRWHKVLIVLSLLLLVFAILGVKSIYDPYGRVITLLIFPSLIYAGFASYRTGHKPALFYTIAWVPYSMGILTAILLALEVLPRLPILEYAIEIGGASEIVLLSLALANRIKVMREEITQKEVEKEQLKSSILEEQKVVLEKTVDERTQELQVANATKDKFFSIIAHDLRSPMIGLQGVGQKLEYFIKKDKQEKLLEMGGQIDRSIDQLNHLLNNLLNWAASQTAGIPYSPQIHSIVPLIEENIELYKSLAKSKEVTLKSEIGDGELYADMNTVSTVIRNLLSNAIKFTEKNSTVLLKSRENGDMLDIMIIDQGDGMSLERAQSLFEENKFTTTTGTKGEKGFGLGLSYVKEIVEAHEGSISLESKLGEGSTFTIRLPRKVSYAQGF